MFLHYEDYLGDSENFPNMSIYHKFRELNY